MRIEWQDKKPISDITHARFRVLFRSEDFDEFGFYDLFDYDKT